MEQIYEMIGRMATDRLWIYTALVGSLFGLAFSTYFKGTRIGIWLYSKFDAILDFLACKLDMLFFGKIKVQRVQKIGNL